MTDKVKYLIVFVLAQLPILFFLYMGGEDMFTRSVDCGFEWFFSFLFGGLIAFGVFASDTEYSK